MTYTDAVKAAIEAGHVKTTDAKVTATVNGTEHERPFVKLEAVNLDGALALCGGRLVEPTEEETKAEGFQRGPSVVGEFNYALDLRQRARERAALLAAMEGPEKQYEKAAKPMFALGLFKSLEDAITFVRTQKEALDKENAEAASTDAPAPEPQQ